MKPRQTGPVSKNFPYNLSIQASGSGSELTAIRFMGGPRCHPDIDPLAGKAVVELLNLPGAKE
jgi:hypothetical protein